VSVEGNIVSKLDIEAPLPAFDWSELCMSERRQCSSTIFLFVQTPPNMASTTLVPSEASPPTWRWITGFLLVGMAWGLTTPFMRKGALSKDQNPQTKRPILADPNASWVRRQIMGVVYAVVDLLKNPAYAVPLLLNVTGSVWFFLLIGQAGEVSDV
jgi:hypothetical protein